MKFYTVWCVVTLITLLSAWDQSLCSLSVVIQLQLIDAGTKTETETDNYCE